MKSETLLDRIADECVEDILSTTDAEIIAESDPNEAQRIRSLISEKMILDVADCCETLDEARAVIRRMERALTAEKSKNKELLDVMWTLSEHNLLHFGKNHNTVILAKAAIAKAYGYFER